MAHLDEDQLLQVTLGQGPAEATAALQAHLAECDDCRTRQKNISSGIFAKTVQGAISKGGLPTVPANRGAAADESPRLERGTPLGRYVLLERLGAGGMGEVFAAFDPHLDRKVALKLLRSGATSAEEGRARLLREAQALARLQHPNVVAVHDVGTLGDRVFIAMEFIEGDTLGDWLRTDRAWSDIVRMFLSAGSGLAAAHAAGLIHRDFKPDNVLVGHDGRPRVVDFGLARQAIATPPTGIADTLAPGTIGDSTLGQPLTQDGAVMGTPGYMAPEQIAGLPTDARCDQFSFCVALFEALHGIRPFGGETLRSHAQEISAGKIATPPPGSMVPAWVDVVVRRGLAADPAKRYADMKELLAALRPRRERGWRLAALIAALTVLALAGAGSAIWSQQALRMCGGAEARLRGVWDAPTKTALAAAFTDTKAPFAEDTWKLVERALDTYSVEWLLATKNTCEAARVRKVDSEELYELKTSCLEGRLQRLQALTRLFQDADRDTVAHANAAVASLDSITTCFDVEALSRRGRGADEKERAAEAALRAKLTEARALFDSGKYLRGAEVLLPALALESPSRVEAEAFLWLARLQLRAGHAKDAQAANVQAAERAVRAGESSLQALAFSRLYGNEGYDETDGDADTWRRLAHAAAARVPTSDWEVHYELAFNDALVALRRRHFDDALADFQRALTLVETHRGGQHPDVASVLNNMGVALQQKGDYELAIEKYQRALELHTSLEGPGHPNTAMAENNLAYALRRKGRYAEAMERYEHALNVRRNTLGVDNPDTLKTMESLAKVYTAVGKRDEALALLQSSLEARTRLNGPESKEVGITYDYLAELYQAGGFWKEAQRYAEQEVSILRKATGDGTLTAIGLYTLGSLETRQGSWSDAKKHLDEALTIRKAKLGAESSEVGAVYSALATLALAQRHAEEADALFSLALQTHEHAGSTTESLATAVTGLGRAKLQLGHAAQAVPLFERAVTLRSQVEDARQLASARLDLGRALWGLDPEQRPRASELISQGVAALSGEELKDAVASLAKQDIPLPSDVLLDAGRP